MKPIFVVLGLLGCNGADSRARDVADSDTAVAVVGWVDVTNETTKLLDLVTVITPEDDWIDWSGTPLSLTAGATGTLELPRGDSWMLAFRTGDRCGFTPFFHVVEAGTTATSVAYIEGDWTENGGCELTD